MEQAELAAWLRLTLAPGLGSHAARQLLRAFGSPSAIFQQDVAALTQVVEQGEAGKLRREPPDFDQHIAATWAWLQQDQAQRALVTLGDPEYPESLLQIADPPLLLYRLGRPLTEVRVALAMVGSRNPTAQGLQNAREFARALAGQGLTIVSGLALGIDGAAHDGALEGAQADVLATIAVVGTGLDRVYPARHRALAHRIAERGALVSEYPIGTPPLPHNFPRRNRLISGLSQGTLVVEAAVQSGSLITARLAAEQGKEVFAIPGSIHSPQARGCHVLLREGAKLAESAQDVLEELQLAPRAPRVDADEAEEGEDDPLLSAMGYDPVGLDALIARTGIPAPQLQATLLELELAGHVARLPGGLFQRVGTA
ncbi:DNA-processing protein DprA [Ramlibacter sp. XY19]|uniref:DNA-processing protein DprA n=1 Tax=Ramlibacter paludis TaxID=2908000 RepID=UPI0023DB519F|nr:DNA-processing protein DprA [Ramlibacter paludis]MCG2594794.1 DNA-processing protein DprA [Ramlibacter paludis]